MGNSPPCSRAVGDLRSYRGRLGAGPTDRMVSGLALTFPPASLGDVLIMPFPGWSPPVFTSAYCNADAAAHADKFRARCQEEFGSSSVSLGQDPETAAYLLALKRRGLTYAQIFDRYHADRPGRFPWAPDDPEYEQKREEAIDAIKKSVRRLKRRLKAAVQRSEGIISE